MKWYLLKKDWGPHKAGEKIQLLEEDAKTLVESGALELVPEDEDPAKKAIQDGLKEAKTQLEALVADSVKKVIGQLKAVASDGHIDIRVGDTRSDDDPTGGFKNIGEFAHYARLAGNPAGPVMDDRIKAIMAKVPTGMAENDADNAGLLVPDQFSTNIWSRAESNSDIINRVDTMPISGNSIVILAEQGDTRAAGVRNAGVRGYWVEEGGQGTGSAPKFKRQAMRVKKMMVLVYATDELLEDAVVALPAFLTKKAGDEIGFMTGDSIINGSGVSQPLGILNSDCLVTVTAETGQAADTIVTENVIKMWSRCYAPSRRNAVWLYNQDIEPQLLTLQISVGTGGLPVFMPPGGLSQSPYGTILGRPAIPCEYCPTLGDKGDIMLVDLSQYRMIRRGGVKSAVSIHLRFDYDESVFKFTYRTDGQPAWSSALTPYKGTPTQSIAVVLAART